MACRGGTDTAPAVPEFGSVSVAITYVQYRPKEDKFRPAPTLNDENPGAGPLRGRSHHRWHRSRLLAIALLVRPTCAPAQGLVDIGVVGGQRVSDALQACRAHGNLSSEECRLAIHAATTTVYVQGVDKLNGRVGSGSGSLVCPEVVLVAAHTAKPALAFGDGFRFGASLTATFASDPFAPAPAGGQIAIRKVAVRDRYVDAPITSSTAKGQVDRIRSAIRHRRRRRGPSVPRHEFHELARPWKCRAPRARERGPIAAKRLQLLPLLLRPTPGQPLRFNPGRSPGSPPPTARLA